MANKCALWAQIDHWSLKSNLLSWIQVEAGAKFEEIPLKRFWDIAYKKMRLTDKLMDSCQGITTQTRFIRNQADQQ